MLYKILKIIFDCILFVFLFIIVSSVLPFKLPIKSFIVVSGSMEPAIKTGSLVFSQSFNKNNIKVGDIIAFYSPKNQQTIIVHRINKISSDGFIFTKGDNNHVPDDWQISQNNIIGKKLFIFPQVGQFFNLVHTPLGFIFIICLPSFIFIVLQSFTIKSALLEIENKKNLKIFLLFFIPLFLIFPKQIHAKFFDSVHVSGINISVAEAAEPAPTSGIISAVLEDQKVKINYTTSSSNFSQIKVCYSYNLNQWQCFVSDKQATFDPPQGDGIYFFNILVGNSGQFEDKDYTQNFQSIEIDQTPPTSNLNLSQSLNEMPYYFGKPIYESTDFSLTPANPIKKLHFNLPQNLNSYISFDYDGQSQSTCDFSSLKVNINNQSVLITGPQELGPNFWIDSFSSQNFFHQLAVGSSDQNVDIDFSLSDSASLDTIFNINNLKIVPISLRTGDTFIPVIDYHDIGSGIGQTLFSQSDNEVSFSSADVLNNQEVPQKIKYQIMSEIVFNKISSDSVDLYINKETNLNGYYFSNVLGETYPVLGITNHLPINFYSNGLVSLINSSGQTIDKFDFNLVKNDSTQWLRSSDGIGTWVAANTNNENIYTSFETNRNNNKLLMTISNIPLNFGADNNDFLEYTIDYQTTSDPKQIYGKIKSDNVQDQKIDREFYLGTCSSGGVCHPETISVGETIYLTIDGQSNGQPVDKKIWQVPF